MIAFNVLSSVDKPYFYGCVAAKKTVRIYDLLKVILHFLCRWQRTVDMDIPNVNQSAAVYLCYINASHLLKLYLVNHLLSLPV